ncbi:MAG: hypothetical protein IKH57_09270 [Clostridia bacterium]|nr:hypothetical protein [Clostridia bacterium]
MLKDLTYRVVIIDDEEDHYEDFVEYIDKKLTTEGYILESEHFEELEELNLSRINEVDLFLVDLKFGKEDKGPDFIRKIRENYLTDILFYSSDATGISNYRKSGEYQGVFFAIRDENNSEIETILDRLIIKMIKRSNTPISSRGIVLGCVAELDNIIKTKIKELLQKIDPTIRKQLMDDCAKIYYLSYKGQSKKIREFWGCDFHEGLKEWNCVKDSYKDYEIVDLVNNIRVTDSSKNFKVLLQIYKMSRGKDELYESIKNLSDLLNDRNIFAHVQEELREDGIYQFKHINEGAYLVLTEEKCQELRKSIIEYRKGIEQLH